MEEQPFMKHCSLHVTKHFAALCGPAQFRTIPHSNFFIPFLAELGNSKHFEPYLFFGQFVVKSEAKCGPHCATEFGWCGKGLEILN